MALRGAGDPRWVVREREDGRNVNGWHWEDKDVSEWAKTRLKALIIGEVCRAPYEGTEVVVDCVDSINGDATLYNRKGVLKVLYDIKVNGKWTTTETDETERTRGEFLFELFDEEPDVFVTVDAKSRALYGCKKAFSQSVVPLIQEQCQTFIAEINAGAGLSLGGVKKKEKKKVTENEGAEVSRFVDNTTREAVRSKPSGKAGKLVLKDMFLCRGSDLYLALTDERKLSAITRQKAVSEATVGGKIDLMGGTVIGSYTKLLIGKEIGMNWKLKTWGESSAAGHVSVRINEEEGKTKVEVIVEGVPNEHRSSTEGFWRVQIFQALKIVMGWGSVRSFM